MFWEEKKKAPAQDQTLNRCPVMRTAGLDKHHTPEPPPPPDYVYGVITVVNVDGTADGQFATFAEALAVSENGDTLQVGAGTYAEVIDLNESVTILTEDGAVLDGSSVSQYLLAPRADELAQRRRHFQGTY